MRKIFVAIPSSADAIKVLTFKALLKAALMGLYEEIFFSVESYAGILPISHCRNVAVSEFLASDCSDLFFLDDDLWFEPEAMLRLIKHPVDFVVAAYPYRADRAEHETKFPVRWRSDLPELIAIDPVSGKPSNDGLLSIEGAGAGFMRLSRRCLEQLTERFESDWYYYDHVPQKKCWKLFDFQTTAEHALWSEDMTFCRKWREIGGTVWLDPNVDFVHIGNKGFTGNLAQWLRARMEKAA